MDSLCINIPNQGFKILSWGSIWWVVYYYQSLAKVYMYNIFRSSSGFIQIWSLSCPVAVPPSAGPISSSPNTLDTGHPGKGVQLLYSTALNCKLTSQEWIVMHSRALQIHYISVMHFTALAPDWPALYCTALHCTALSCKCTGQDYTADILDFTALNCTALAIIVQCCHALHCIAAAVALMSCNEHCRDITG